MLRIMFKNGETNLVSEIHAKNENQQNKEQGEYMLTNIESRKMNELLEEFDEMLH